MKKSIYKALFGALSLCIVLGLVAVHTASALSTRIEVKGEVDDNDEDRGVMMRTNVTSNGKGQDRKDMREDMRDMMLDATTTLTFKSMRPILLGKVTTVSSSTINITGIAMPHRATTTYTIDASSSVFFTGVGKNFSTTTISAVVPGGYVAVLGSLVSTTTIKAVKIYAVSSTTPGVIKHGDKDGVNASTTAGVSARNEQGKIRSFFARIFSPFTFWLRR